jgi:hypothetical protein
MSPASPASTNVAANATPPRWQMPSSKENKTARDQIAPVRRSSAKGRLGQMQFFLQRIAGGLYVEREEAPSHGTRIQLAMCFADRISFEHWCNDDAMRFEYPVLHQRIQRDAETLWQIEP